MNTAKAIVGPVCYQCLRGHHELPLLPDEQCGCVCHKPQPRAMHNCLVCGGEWFGPNGGQKFVEHVCGPKTITPTESDLTNLADDITAAIVERLVEDGRIFGEWRQQDTDAIAEIVEEILRKGENR